MTELTQLTLVALPGIPYVQPGDDLARLIVSGLESAGLTLDAGDILVVTSKLISKSEGRFVDLRTVTPSPQALDVGEKTNKDPRLVELILRRVVPHLADARRSIDCPA